MPARDPDAPREGMHEPAVPHVGEFPGPRARALLAEQSQWESSARSYPRRLPIAIRRGFGAYVEDVDGNVFIDFLTGAGVMPLGHSHPEVVEAVRQQLDLLVSALDLPTPSKREFIEVYRSILPETLRDRMRIQFCSPSGADAVDAALKLCKTATGRSNVIAFHGAFHGSSHSAMAVSGLLAQKEPIASLIPGVHFFPYPYCRHCPVGLEPTHCTVNCLTYLETTLRDPYGGLTKPAAVLVESIQGEGGVIPARPEFLQGLRQLTRELDIPLILDEIQSGCGRTGSWFGFEESQIEPDVILISKAAGGIGLPVAALFYDERLDVWEPGAHTGTFRGNQLAFVAGVATIRIMQRDGVLVSVVEQGRYAFRRLQQLARAFPQIGDVRGRGLMIGVEFVDCSTGRPDGQIAARVQAEALHRGLIIEIGGRNEAVARLLPPLNIDRPTLAHALTIFEEATKEACQ